MDCRLDKTKFHLKRAGLFSAMSTILHPISVVKTRTQVAGDELSHMNGLAVCKHIVKANGVFGILKSTVDFGTNAFDTSRDVKKIPLPSIVPTTNVPKPRKTLETPSAFTVCLHTARPFILANLAHAT